MGEKTDSMFADIVGEELKCIINNIIWMRAKPDMTMAEAEDFAIKLFDMIIIYFEENMPMEEQ